MYAINDAKAALAKFWSTMIKKHQNVKHCGQLKILATTLCRKDSGSSSLIILSLGRCIGSNVFVNINPNTA